MTETLPQFVESQDFLGEIGDYVVALRSRCLHVYFLRRGGDFWSAQLMFFVKER